MTEQDEDHIEDRARTLYERFRRRWYLVLLALILLLLSCCLLSPQARTLVLGYYEEWFGGQGDDGGAEPTEQVEDTRPEDDQGLPPTDEPTPTDEPEPTEETAEVGDGTCNERCDPENSNCLAGLSCLPVGARQPGVYVCWSDAICQPATDEPPPTDEGGGGGCGDGTCGAGESPATCPQDCGLCGNGVCDPGEHVYNCSPDCGEPPPPPGPVTCYCVYNGCPLGTLVCTDGVTTTSTPDAACNNC